MICGSMIDDIRVAVGAHPPQLRPVVVVVVGQQAAAGLVAQVGESLQALRSLRLLVDRRIHLVAVHSEHYGHGMRPTVRTNRDQAGDPRRGETLTSIGGIHVSTLAATGIRAAGARETLRIAEVCKRSTSEHRVY